MTKISDGSYLYKQWNPTAVYITHHIDCACVFTACSGIFSTAILGALFLHMLNIHPFIINEGAHRK